jgi:FkbM family methyltransferase
VTGTTFERRRRWAVPLALAQPTSYVVVANVLRTAKRPVDVLGRYVLGRGAYPATVAVRTPTGPVVLTAHTPDDVLTINEVFFRRDYRAGPDDEVVVDIGANIGISAAYFLSRSRRSRVHVFEPLPQNLERLAANLAPFAGRVEVHPCAVGVRAGTAEFGWEPTGRYGGIGNETGNYLTVDCVEINDALRRVLDEHGRIDVLKIDVETLEADLLAALDPGVARRIRRLYVELRPATNPLAATHDLRQRGSVARFTRRSNGR